MELDRETVIEIVVSVGAVALFVAVIYTIGLSYGDDGLIGPEGGTTLVAAIAAFIVLMTLIGYWLSGRES
jgi:hypothetical protein